MLTTEFMRKYVGGQLEIQGHGEFPNMDCRRGQLKNIEVSFNVLKVEFDYVCELQIGKGYSPCENKPAEISLSVCGSNEIGDNRLAVISSVLGELWVFYPPDHHKRILSDGVSSITIS